MSQVHLASQTRAFKSCCVELIEDRSEALEIGSDKTSD